MRRTRHLGISIALITAALLGGTLIGSAFATDSDPSASPGAAGAADTSYCDTFLDAFAAELGATRDEVVAAGQAAAHAAVDAAVAAGDISEERASRLRTKIDEVAGVDCGALRGFGFGHGDRAPGLHGGGGLGRFPAIAGVIDTLAQELGLEPAEVLEQLAEAGSLEALAGQLGVGYDELKATVVGEVQAALGATDLSAERQASILERVQTWLDEGGQVGGRGWRFWGPGGHENDGPDASDEASPGG
jgi:hypothetical protein